MNDKTVQAGCSKCGREFYLPIDEETGQPIWYHICPMDELERKLARVDEKLDKLLEKE